MFLLKCLILLFTLSLIDADLYYRPCGHPRLLNGRVRLRQRGTFAKFSCLPHYMLIGNKYATCRNGMWDVPLPICVRPGCPQLEEVKNSVNMTTHENSWIVFFCLPKYKLFGSPVVYCDGRRWNSTAPQCIVPNEVAKTVTECDFEKPDICGWKRDELHDFDWKRWNQKTPSSFLQTGPLYDHTYGKNGSGYYMYVESTARLENETARLLSPVYDADLARNACFVFYYHMFGRSMGGLRVYQKPDQVSMDELLSAAVRSNYTLFEEWGDQGNEWYGSVSMLTDYSDDFQIVIEGIRGHSFMSDIAIDDVSIQHGENCTAAMAAAVTPPSVLLESCAGRCDTYNVHVHPSARGCSCSLVCLINENCCTDFFEICDFVGSDRTDEPDTTTTESRSSAAPPQTDKLVALTTSSSPATTGSTAPTPNWSRIIVNITRLTASTTTPITTTRRPTTRYYLRSTTKRLPTTTKSPETYKTTPSTTTRPPTTTARPTTKVIKSTIKNKGTTLKLETTPVRSTTIFFVQTTKVKDDRGHSTTIGLQKAKQNNVAARKSEGMSGALVATIVFVLGVVCCAAMWVLVVWSRSPRGLLAISRLRAQATHDSEVHYLKSDVDE